MNLYQYYEQKNTADKPAAVSKAYKVIDRICKTIQNKPDHRSLTVDGLDRTELIEALVILHLVAESRKNDYLKVKTQLEDLLAAKKAALQQDLDNLKGQ